MTVSWDDLAEAKRLAEEATPGPWLEGDSLADMPAVWARWEEGIWRVAGTTENADAAFIAHWNPAFVLELVREVERCYDKIALCFEAIANAEYALDPNQGERPDPVRASMWLRTTFPPGHPNYVDRAALANPAAENACEHDWVDMRNEVIASGYWCRKCNAIRASEEGND